MTSSKEEERKGDILSYIKFGKTKFSDYAKIG
jgi:hypothetical protein